MLTAQELNKKTGNRLKVCIENSGMTQKEIAGKASYTEQHISKLVKGKCKLTTDTARSLSKILHVRLEYLLCEDDYRTEWEKISSEMDNLKRIPQNICTVLDCKGYRLVDDEYIQNCEPFKTISLSYPYEIAGKTDKEILDNITEKIDMADAQQMLALKHPDGRIIRITSTRLHELLKDIEQYIDYQMYLEYNKIENYLYPADIQPNKRNN